MDHVFSVPVKSLVKTEEDEDEELMMLVTENNNGQEEIEVDHTDENGEEIEVDHTDENREEIEVDHTDENGEENPPGSVLKSEPNPPTPSDTDDVSMSDESPSAASSGTSTPIPKYDPFPPQVNIRDCRVLKNSLEGAIHHMFLPKRLPDATQPNLLDIEYWMLQNFTDVCEGVLKSEKLQPIRKMLLCWSATQPKCVKDRNYFGVKFSTAVTRMCVGDTIPVYVRNQNSTLLISKIAKQEHDNPTYVIETFRPCLPSESVMSNIGNLEVTYPETTDLVYNSEMLCSKTFAKKLHELAVDEFQWSMSTGYKADKEFMEYREVPDPFLITDFIVALLVPTWNNDSSVIKITKKVRDEINCKRSAKAVPFRRSGMWTSIKVALHLKVLHVAGNENDAKIIYKCLLLRVLSEVTRHYEERFGKNINIDLTGQMLAKLGRRVKKLQKMTLEAKSGFVHEIKTLWNSTLQYAHFVVRTLSTKMTEIWNEQCAPTVMDIIEPVNRTQKQFQDDLLHFIPWLNEHIAKEKSAAAITEKFGKGSSQNSPSLMNYSKNQAVEILQRFSCMESIMTSVPTTNLVQRRVWLYDTEQFIKYKLMQVAGQIAQSPEEGFRLFSTQVLDLASAYLRTGSAHYIPSNSVENPVGYSQMLLVTLRIVQVLDQVATAVHPLLLQYKSGISHVAFDKLLLPHADDVRLLDGILDYFRERDLRAEYPGLLDSLMSDVSESCFASRYAAGDVHMVKCLQDILQDVNARIFEKQKEVENAREQCIQMQQEFEEKQAVCENCKTLSLDNTPVSECTKCTDCTKLEDALMKKRYGTPVYERVLPEELHVQYALVFELLIPEEIKSLREALAILKFDLLKEQVDKTGNMMQVKWTCFKNLQNYRSSSGKEGTTPYYNLHVNLCSKVLPTSYTHFTNIKNPDLLSTVAVRQDDDTWAFVVPNGMDAVYHYTPHKYFELGKKNRNPSLAFQVSSCKPGTCVNGIDPYSTLQWALDGTSHSQNRVIAEFSSTHYPDVIAYGSLRAGHRIQIMNLYRGIANGQLRLDKEVVLALVLQTLWEVGPRTDYNAGPRESHLDLHDTEFTTEFLDLIEKLIENNESNYANPLILATAIAITCRVMELNTDLAARCYQVLKKCRACSDSWVSLIQEEIDKRETLTEQENRNWNTMLIQVLICSTLTYNVRGELSTVQDGGDLMSWFDTISRLYELTQEAGVCAELLSPFGNLLLEMARNVPLTLGLESRLCDCVPLKDVFVKSLHLFSCEKWNWTAGAGTWKLMEDHECSNIVIGRYQQDLLTFDMVQGKFLVSGYSRSGIPCSISQHPVYNTWFRGSRTLRVVQNGVKNRGVVVFRTSEKFMGKHYEFRVEGGSVSSVTEVQDDGKKLELIDPEKFLTYVSDDLVFQYTHWLDIENRTVCFRKLPVCKLDYAAAPEFVLKAHETTQLWLLYDELHRSYVFNRKSQGFDIVAGSLTRLEKELHMTMLMSGDDDRVFVNLPRYRLNFFLDETGRLESVEYKGFKVSYNQAQRGTLIGFQHGLLLDNIGENVSIVKRILIVPHGNLTVMQGKIGVHQRTRVDITHLRNPPFFTYELDQVLKRLKADKSKCAWIYLAALHGITSTGVPCLPDPFTNLTGTEMAMQILQSGCVWSCSPYDYECMASLKMIRKLAPRREYYGHGLLSRVGVKKRKVGVGSAVASPEPEEPEQIETSDWAPGLPSMVCYDGYALVVDRLVADSCRMKVLYNPNKVVGEEQTFMNSSKWGRKLQLRGYYRHLNAYNNASVIKQPCLNDSVEKLNSLYVEPELLVRRRQGLLDGEESQEYHSLNLQMLMRMSQARFVSTLEDPGSSRKSNLYSFLLGPRDSLEYARKETMHSAYPLPDFDLHVPLTDLLDSSVNQFRQNWLKFYGMALEWKGCVEGRQAFTVVLSSLAYCGAPYQQLVNLHNINVLAEHINFPRLDESVRECSFTEYVGEDFEEEKIRAYLKDTASGNYQRARYYDKNKFEESIDKIVNVIKGLWPCDRIPKRTLEEMYAYTSDHWSIHDLKQINLRLRQWHRNYLLKEFVTSVESFVDKFYEHFPPVPKHGRNFDLMGEVKLEVRLKGPEKVLVFENVSGLTVRENVDEAAVIFCSGRPFHESGVESMIIPLSQQCVLKIEEYEKTLHTCVNATGSKKVIAMSGLALRTSPLMLLQVLLHGMRISPGSVDHGVLKLIGALAVLWTELKRFNKLQTLIQNKTSGLELTAELENTGHENWSPFDYPEWLILELELDIMIRSIQVDVARQMIKMPGDRNGVMQLNMGEGKTSVIVPMLCVALANGKDSICRVTVLNSIYKTNLNLLSFAVGGIVLNRRVYTFPCRRDMSFTLELLDTLLDSYRECLKLKGVVLTLPEHRLSFRLLGLDKALKGYTELGARFMGVENGLDKFCRDVMDESDELLNVKYQLVYTIGMQVGVDGNSLRWTTCQKVLQIVQDIAWVLLQKLGNIAVEFDAQHQVNYPERFAYVRILDKQSNDEFLNLVADEILKETKLTERQKSVCKRFLTMDNISEENFKSVLGLFKNDEGLLDEIRLVSGYLRRGILGLALSKRWRVEYGVDVNGGKRMAVPFRAKDVAAERTEFGHPDLAIVLTHLSYYYSGLTDNQLDEVFSTLRFKNEAEVTYNVWISRISRVPGYLGNYNSVNLQDGYQKSVLYDLLRKHKSVIDFWLGNCVLPRECKQFPGKITSNAWDLVSDRMVLPTTGFSGTNDSSVLLPLPISQQDLGILENTNNRMEGVLMQSENTGHRGLRFGVTCSEVLNMMKDDGLTVLIDAGAIMLECDNEEVADLWLSIDDGIEAVVYFGRDNNMLVKVRRGHQVTEEQDGGIFNKNKKSVDTKPDTLLDVSPYKHRLEVCGVFLDDQHTRGTDLKFPIGSKGAVTIGSRMRRDKLMQACMRMRQLGSGHSVAFYLSHEASNKVGELTTRSVLEWVKKNTEQHNKDGMVYWALNGKNYAQKLAAQMYHDQGKAHAFNRIVCLANQCVDNEVISLKDMYGVYTEAEVLSKIIPEWFENTHRKLISVEGCCALANGIMREFDKIKNSIVSRVNQHVPDHTYFSGGINMDEEQEKEVELENEAEAEEERQIVQVRKQHYFEPCGLHENVKQLVLLGGTVIVKQGIGRLPDVFANTSFAKLVQPDGWASAEVYATTDFINVVKNMGVDDEDADKQSGTSSLFKTDGHLRPVEYVVSVRAPTPKEQRISRRAPPVPAAPLQLLLLSPFEVNELLPYFRSAKAKTQLHMFTPRLSPNSDLLCNNINLQLPRPLQLQQQNAPVLLNLIPESSKCLSALLVCSGNLYFATMEEQKAFSRFLGIIPRPWSSEQMNAFEKEMIKKSGFLLPKYRSLEIDCQVDQDAFQKDPIPMVRKIYACRHAVVSDNAHVSKLLNHNWYVDIN